MRVYNHKIRRFLTFAVPFIGLALAIYFQSRAFTFGFLVAILFSYAIVYKDSLKFFCSGLSILFVVLIVMVFLLKIDSSLGRILIYKISWIMFKDNWLFGIGLGNFKIKYGLYQARYFEQNIYTQKEFLLADNVFFAFNDYWQFIVETGIVGLCLLLGSLFIIVKLVNKRFAEYKSHDLLRLIITLFIAICSTALFTHVFEREIFQLFLIVVIAWLIVASNRLSLKIVNQKVILIGIVGSCLIYQYHNYLFNFKSYYKFEQTKSLSAMGYLSESQRIYKEIFPILKDDVDFLRSYIDKHSNQSDQYVALETSLYLIKKRTDNRTYLRLGKTYERLKMYKKAEEAYLISVNMVPNRFTTRLTLFNFYIKMQNFQKAKEMGNVMLRMPVKVPSNKVSIIKQEIVKKMRNYCL